MSETPAAIRGTHNEGHGNAASNDDLSNARQRAEELAQEMADRWEQGDRAAAETFLQREPGITRHPEAAIRLIYEELCLAQEAGLETTADDFRRRFPQWRTELEAVLECDRLLKPEAVTFPAVGTSLGGFRLLSELGRGAQSRVFLATQTLLAGRLVVLKVSPLEGEEHLLLSSLQHAHVAPLYCIYDDPERRLRAFCMPYLGGTTLDRVLAGLCERPRGEWSGKAILEVLDRHRSPHLSAKSYEGPARRLLERLSYHDAIAWMAGCLADALAHVHERGLVHLDIKPSNVLIAADGQPMLLDFHLSRPPIVRGEGALGALGGTAGYMSPEQQAVFAAARAGAPAPQNLDGRSDLYSLALVLVEALGDLPKNGGRNADALRAAANGLPGVSPGLAGMLRRCLLPQADSRYPDARALADDLRRQLKDLPLLGVRNRWSERWRKWRRRRPSAPALMAMLAVVLLAATTALALGGIYLARERQQAEQSLVDAARWLEAGQFDDAAQALRQGVTAAAHVPGGDGLQQELQQALAHVHRARLVHELQTVVDLLRMNYGVESTGLSQRRALAEACRALWDRRAELVPAEQEGRSNAGGEDPLETLQEFGLLWADLRRRLGDDGARQEALAILSETAALCGPNDVLAFEAWRHDSGLGEPPVNLSPASAWEQWALGRALLASGRQEPALGLLRSAAEQTPERLWPHFYRAHCAYRMGRFEEARAAAEASVALSPRRAECFNLRGLVKGALNELASAKADFSRALKLDPDLGMAALNRAAVYLDEGRLEEARADLAYAATHGAPEEAVRRQLALLEGKRVKP